MDTELLLKDYSGKAWSQGSPSREYLEHLPIMNLDDSYKETDTRCLLPRKNIYTFGLEQGISGPVVYYACKLCPSFIKSHEVKQHMLANHLSQENTSGNSQDSNSAMLSSSLMKQKKNSHKSKKKVVPPPSVPPPPLFPKLDSIQHSSCTSTSSVVNNNNNNSTLPDLLLPPMLIPAKDIVINDVNEIIVVDDTESLLTTPNVAPALITEALPPTLSMLPPKGLGTVLKRKEKSLTAKTPENHNITKHKRSKRSKSSTEFDPDKHCGVLDTFKGPCMRALTCAMHNIIERRAVSGRSKSLDTLLTEYKNARSKHKSMAHSTPITIAPKQSCVKEVRNGFNVMDLLYDPNEGTSKNNKGDDRIIHSAIDDLKSRVQPVLNSLPNISTNNTKNAKVPLIAFIKSVTPKCIVQPVPQLEPLNDEDRVPTRYSHPCAYPYSHPFSPILRGILSSTSPPLCTTKPPEVPLQGVSALYNLHPKPLTMPTVPLHRVGGALVLQQAPRLERQRMDLKAVVAQHKQLKSTSNKSLILLNSNQNKQSLLKSSVKNNHIKMGPGKRPMLEKTITNEVKHESKHIKILSDILLNPEFSVGKEMQGASAIIDKLLLK